MIVVKRAPEGDGYVVLRNEEGREFGSLEAARTYGASLRRRYGDPITDLTNNSVTSQRYDWRAAKSDLETQKGRIEGTVRDVKSLRDLPRFNFISGHHGKNAGLQLRQNVRTWMKRHLNDYEDARTGEINHTLIAEEASQRFDLYERSHHIPEWVFDMALEVDPYLNRPFQRVHSPSHHPLTVTLSSGLEVTAKMYKGQPAAKTYSNRAQAKRAADAMGSGWTVYQKGRPFYVGRVSSIDMRSHNQRVGYSPKTSVRRTNRISGFRGFARNATDRQLEAILDKEWEGKNRDPDRKRDYEDAVAEAESRGWSVHRGQRM